MLLATAPLPSVADMNASRIVGVRRWQAAALLAMAATMSACETKTASVQNTPASSARAEAPPSYGLGHAPSAVQLAAVDIDANGSGVGLPPGQGTAALGTGLFAQKCAFCHGPHGEGQGPYPQLIGRTPDAGFVFASDAKAPKTIGNYWPYATTVYDYVHRAMPFNAPGSLTPDETYSIVAYLLSENGVIAPSAVMNAKTLPAVQMPARPHFVPDNRTGGKTFR